MEKEKTTSIKTTETGKLAYKFITGMYARALEAKETGAPIAWIMGSGSGVTEVLLHGMDVVPIYPENYGAACAAKRANIPLLDSCEAEGFSRFICGYARTCLGFARQVAEYGAIPPDVPLRGMAKPTVLIGRSLLCDAGYKWFQSLGRYMDVPLFCIDYVCPAVGPDLDEVTKYNIQYQAEELRACVSFLEKHLGRKMDMDKLSEIVATGEKTRGLWHECQELRKAIPCPMASQDMWACMVPGYWMPGYQETVEFYQKLYDELKYRVDNKMGAIANERYRMLFAELPPWHTLELFDYLASLGAVCVIESYYYYSMDIAPQIPEGVTDPIERLAWWSYQWWTRSYRRADKEAINYVVQEYLDWVRDYRCDGALIHDLISCRSATLRHVHTKNVLLKYAKIPSLTMEGDIVDARSWSEAEIKSRADAFVESMEHYKRIREQEAAG